MVPGQLVVAILDWNGYALTRSCAESVRALASPSPRILVVDNGSIEPEGEHLAAELGPGVESLRLPQNLGVGGGYNAAIAWAAAAGSSHVLLLNNDTLITDPSMLQRLVDACSDGVLAVGPLIRDSDGSLFSAGGLLSWPTARTGHRREDAIPSLTAPYPVSWIDGSCLLVSVEAACRIGGFDEEFFLYWEEVDLCVRGVRAGLRCLVEPRTSITHLGSRSARPSQIDHLMLRNAILFMRRNAQPADLVRFLLHLVTWRIPRFVARRSRHGAPLSESLGMVARSLGWNLRDILQKRAVRPAATGSLRCPR